MSRKPKREPSPFEIIESIRLSDVNGRNTPAGFVERVLSPPSDYEVILAQGYEIAHLRALLDRADNAYSVKLESE